MDDKKYELRFLPLFEDDLNEIVDHISNKQRCKVILRFATMLNMEDICL